MDLTDLMTQGFVRVPYPDALRRQVAIAMESWHAFYRLTEEEKLRCEYSGYTNVSGVGYELKLEAGPTADRKEDFHLRVSEREYLEREAEKVGPAATRFVTEALALTWQMAPTILAFAREAEQQFGLADLHADTEEKIPRALIRFLHYFGDREPGDILAVPHVDKGAFTFHLYESHPGLERLTKSGEWEPMDFDESETIIIPAMRLQYRSRNNLLATCHRVVANEETARIGRYSAVCFLDFSNTPYYDKARHGRLQEMSPGFNYNLPFTEFASLFTP